MAFRNDVKNVKIASSAPECTIILSDSILLSYMYYDINWRSSGSPYASV